MGNDHLDSKNSTVQLPELTIEDIIKDVMFRLVREHKSNPERDGRVVLGIVMLVLDRAGIRLTWEERKEFV